MSKPIRLWRPRQTRTFDEAGITVLKTTLPQASRTSTQYDLATQSRGKPNHLPSLTYFCFQALLGYPDEIHTLGPLRLTYRPPKTREAHDILRELIPAYRPDRPLDLTRVDPRLWALLVQLYDDIPAQFRVYTLPLADTHVPLLQRIPPTPEFALLTILELPGCQELTDKNIVLLKELHSLCAFDASGTALGTWGIKSLAKTLTISEDEEIEDTSPSAHRRGPWGLRILSLRDCINIEDKVFDCLPMFPLLSVVDIRGTRCRYKSASSFEPCPHGQLFHPTPFPHALSTLDMLAQREQCTVFSHPQPYVLRVNGLEHNVSSASARAIRSSDETVSIGSRRDVFRPPANSPNLTRSSSSLGVAGESPGRDFWMNVHATVLREAQPEQGDVSWNGEDEANEGDSEITFQDFSNRGLHGSPGQRDMVRVAEEETLLAARHNSVMRFYEQSVARPRAPTAFNVLNRVHRPATTDSTKLMLFRFPPAWDSLPTSGLGHAPSNVSLSGAARRKRARVDAPLADGHLLSTNAARKRADVTAAVTALHASLQERQATAEPASPTEAEPERSISRNPFARTAKVDTQAKARLECQKPVGSLAPEPSSRKGSSSRLGETSTSAADGALKASALKVKALKPISQLRIPPAPAPPSGSRPRKHVQPVRAVSKPPSKNTQATVAQSLLAGGKAKGAGRSAASSLIGTLGPKVDPKRTPGGSKIKPGSENQSKSRTSFDLRAWCASK